MFMRALRVPPSPSHAFSNLDQECLLLTTLRIYTLNTAGETTVGICCVVTFYQVSFILFFSEYSFLFIEPKERKDQTNRDALLAKGDEPNEHLKEGQLKWFQLQNKLQSVPVSNRGTEETRLWARATIFYFRQCIQIREKETLGYVSVEEM